MKKHIRIILLAVAVIVSVIKTGSSVKKYLDACPSITPRSFVYAEVGTSIPIEQLADIERSTESRILPKIEWRSSGANDLTDARVNADGQAVFVGNYAGEFDVTVNAVGGNKESRQAKVTVTVYIAD